MAVLHDYVCLAHGKFDSFSGKCPHGCGDAMVKKLLSAPAFLSHRTKVVDQTLKGMAREYGMSDFTDKDNRPKEMKNFDTFAAAPDSGYASGISPNDKGTDAGITLGDVFQEVGSRLGKPKIITHASCDRKGNLI